MYNAYKLLKRKIYFWLIRFFYKFGLIYNPRFNTAFKNIHVEEGTLFDLQNPDKINKLKFEENLLISVQDDHPKNYNKKKPIFEAWIKNRNYVYSDNWVNYYTHKKKILKSFLEKPKIIYKKKIFLLPYYHSQFGHFVGEMLGGLLYYLDLFKKRSLNEKILLITPSPKWEVFFKKFYKKNIVFIPDNTFIKKNIFFTKSQILPKFHPFQNINITKNILAPKIENKDYISKKVFLTSERNERILNIKEVITFLKKKNFSVINPSKLSIIELLKILNSAKIVVTECASISMNVLISRNKPYYVLLPNSFKSINRTWYRTTGIYSNFHSSLYRPIYFLNYDSKEFTIPLNDQIKVDLKKLNFL